MTYMRLPKNPMYPNFKQVHKQDDWCPKAGCTPVSEREFSQWYQMQSENELRQILRGIPSTTQYGSFVSYHLLTEQGKEAVRDAYAKVVNSAE